MKLEEGFKFWREEVDSLQRPEKMVPYIPAIALVGIYTVCIKKPELLNSYSWRQSVLDNEDAINGMRKSLGITSVYRIDDTYSVPVDMIKPEEGAALQHVCAYQSLIDGLPNGTLEVPENELFLAQTLGYAEHDYGITFYPLRMSAGGIEALRNNYPLTAEMVQAAV